MKHKILSTFVLICLGAAVQARLGDSFTQSITRFGKPLGHFKDKYAEAALFEYKNYAVFVRYRYDKSFEETYAYLAPGVKDKLHKEKYWEDSFDILNAPENLEALTGKQRNMLRTANLKATWKFGEFKANGIEEMSAVLGKRKVTGDYYLSRKILVITEKNAPPPPKASDQEVHNMTNMYMPLDSTFKECISKYGLPYELSAPKYCLFQKSIYLIKVNFVNKRSILNDKSADRIMKYMYNGQSTGIVYAISPNANLKEQTTKIKTAQKLIYRYRDYTKLTTDEKADIMFQSVKASIILEKTLLSLPLNLIQALLKKYSYSEWLPISGNKIEDICFSTWKNGRRLYGTYNIISKNLKIEYGTAYDDYKPEVIKKLKEKKATEALEGF